MHRQSGWTTNKAARSLFAGPQGQERREGEQRPSSPDRPCPSARDSTSRDAGWPQWEGGERYPRHASSINPGFVLWLDRQNVTTDRVPLGQLPALVRCACRHPSTSAVLTPQQPRRPAPHAPIPLRAARQFLIFDGPTVLFWTVPQRWYPNWVFPDLVVGQWVLHVGEESQD